MLNAEADAENSVNAEVGEIVSSAEAVGRCDGFASGFFAGVAFEAAIAIVLALLLCWRGF